MSFNDESKFFEYCHAFWIDPVILFQILEVIPQRTVFPKDSAILSNNLFVCWNCWFVVKTAEAKDLKLFVPASPNLDNSEYNRLISIWANSALTCFILEVPKFILKVFSKTAWACFIAFSSCKASLVLLEAFGAIFWYWLVVKSWIDFNSCLNWFKLLLSTLNLIPYWIVPPVAISFFLLFM